MQKFHLVDTAGNPLDERFHQATRKLERHFLNKLPALGDEAIISNCVEETARKVHAHEQKNGRVSNLNPFFLRVYTNVVNSLLRGPYYTKFERNVTKDELERFAGSTRTGSAENTEQQILVNETLRGLSERKRVVLLLDAIGCSAREIAKQLGTTETNVFTMLHRARQEARNVCKEVA